MNLLKLGVGNAKLGKNVAIVDLPAGHTCCQSRDCGDKVDRLTGKLIANPHAKFRCFSAVSELISKAARLKRWHNFDLIKKLKTKEQIAKLLINSLKANKDTNKAELVRIHTSGDFFSQMYFDAWLIVARAMPEKIFYAYTKSLKFWVARLNEIPENLHLIASSGSKHDELIKEFKLKTVEVVYSVEEAEKKKLEIDHDDSHCYNRRVKKFALLIHGTQLAGSEAMKAVMKGREVNV